MAQPLMGLPRQLFKQSNSFPGAGENDMASQLFDQFCSANTFQGIMDTFQQMCDVIGLYPVDHQIFYKQLKAGLLSWKAQSLWSKLDKRSANLEYKKGTACNKTRALVIGCGPCGLRVAVEIALLGGKVVIVEKREGFSRNNVLHLWPFLIHDLKALGAKKFFGKFCAGAIDHISIRALQCILLKVALLVGVEVHSGVMFEGFSEPPSNQKTDKIGWRAKVTPEDHPVSEFLFDVCISADGRRNTMTEFKRKEFRGKLAIAITANFINHRSKAEASVEEISGVAYIFNQKFFKDLNHHAGIDLENIVYYKDETHYFVMTAKKRSLLCKGVLLQDYDDPEILLSKENVDQQALLNYARQAADMSTQHRLPNLEFAHNHYGQPDIAMFDFTSMFAAEHACRVVERQGHRLLIALVGDTLLEPFWPTGSGCARGFLGAFDAAWMIQSWSSGKMTPLEVIAERESVYQLLSQTTPENLNKNYLQYTIDPNTRYLNLNTRYYKPHQVASQYDGHDKEYLNEIVRQAVQQSNRYDSVRDSHNLLKWIQRQLESYQIIIKVVDFSSSWRSGLALCALIHRHRPELLDIYSLDPNRVEVNNQLAFDVIEKEFGVLPIMTGLEMAQREAPDKMAMASYLSHVCSILRKESANAAKVSGNKSEAVLKTGVMSLTKIGNLIHQRQEEMETNELSSLKRFQDPLSCDVPNKRVKDLYDGNSSTLNTFGKLENLDTFEEMSKYTNLQKELRLLGHGIKGRNKVSVLAKDLASKLSGEASRLAEESVEVSRKAETTDFCYFCKNRVYTVERYTAEGLFFHRTCFRCDFCGHSLRISCYSFKETGNGEGKFYCVQHHGLQRSADHIALETSKITSGKRLAVPSSKMTVISGIEKSMKRTTERVEYVTESEVEESEYEQTKHNLCSVLRPSAFSDSDSSSSEEELHFSDEEASDEQPDLSWAELARKYSAQLSKTKLPRPRHKRTSSASSGSETETAGGANDADWETDSNTDKENDGEESGSFSGAAGGFGVRQRGSRDEFAKRLLSLSPKQNIRLETKPSPTSVEIMRNRMAFFSTVSQPVRIDARAFLGLAPPRLSKEKTPWGEECVLESEKKEQREENSKAEEIKESNRALQQIKPENGSEERPSKRRAEKKPVIQKVKKRTKRRKKDEKSHVTANVGTTKLSIMHEAVPVVAISGATSSDEQCDLKMADATELLDASKQNIASRVADSCSDEENAAEKESDKMLGGKVELQKQDLSKDHHLAEDGSSQSKSASENSQTLQYSDSGEDINPLCEMINDEPMLASIKSTPVAMDPSAIENGEFTMQTSRLSDVQDPAVTRDLSLSDEKQFEELENTKKETLQDHSRQETDDDQKLEHEYVILEECITHSDSGKFTPYEELVTDGSDKDYTGIQIGPLDAISELNAGRNLCDDRLDKIVCKNGDDFDHNKPGVCVMIAEEENVQTWSEAVEYMEGMENRQTYPMKTSEVCDDLDVQISSCAVLQNQLKPNGIKVASEENCPAMNEVIGDLANVEESTSFPLNSVDVIDEIGVQTRTCDALCIKSLYGDEISVTDNSLTGVDGKKLFKQLHSEHDVHSTLDTEIYKRNQGKQKALDPLSRINFLLESLSVSKTGILDSSSNFEIEQQTHTSNLKNGPSESEDSKNSRPDSLIIVDNGINGDICHYDTSSDILKDSKSLELIAKQFQKPGGNELLSDCSIRNASATSGSVDLWHEHSHGVEQLTSPTDESITDGRLVTSLPYDDGSSVDQLAADNLSEDLLSLENAVEMNTEREALTCVKDDIRSKVVIVGNQLRSKKLEIETSKCRGLTAVDVANAGSSGSAVSVLSPNRIMDAKRKFFSATTQPVRIDHRQLFKDIPSVKQPAVAKEIAGEESSVISGESDSISQQKEISVRCDLSVFSSGSEIGSGSLVESLTESQSASLSGLQIESTALHQQKRVLPTIPTTQSSQTNLTARASGTVDASAALPATSSSISGKFKVQESDFKIKKSVLKGKKRPNSAFVVIEENLKPKGRSSFGLGRPTSSKPSHFWSGHKPGSPALVTDVIRAQETLVSQSDGASTEEMSPSLALKDKESRLKNLYQMKSKGKDLTAPVSKELQDKKDKRKSLLAILIPSRSLDKKEKSTKSPVLHSKSRQHESKPSDSISMSAVREKTKSLPLEKKQPPSMVVQESKKQLAEKSKGKVKSKMGKTTTDEPPETGQSIFKEMAGIMEGIKKVEKRNRDKISIRDRIEAVAPPPAKAPYTVLLPPKADIEDFETESEFGDDRLSLRSFQSQMHLLSEEEVAKLRKRQQKAAQRKQREKELKRLHAAQEIQQQMEEVEMRQREIERLGVEIEKALSGEETDKQCDEAGLVQRWFDIVHERNVLMRCESELMVHARELELEDRQSRLEIQLRERIPHAESQRTESIEEEEQRILQELMEVVEQRDALVVLLEEDRIRQQQYSKNLERIMVDRGFQLSPISHLHLPLSLAALPEDR